MAYHKYRLIGAAILAATFTAGETFGQTTYTWIGGSDLNWSNTANWASGILPVDDAPGVGNNEGISMGYLDVIEFSGSTMPTQNLPGIGGFYTADLDTNNTPRMVFNSGGEFDLAMKGYEDHIMTNPHLDRNVFTIGDGISGGTEDVIVNWTGGAQLSRHGNNTHEFLINADGTLNKSGAADFSRGSGRIATMTINGGTVVVSGTTYDLKAQGAAVINFAALGSSYQSAWGGEFNSIPDVEDSIGTDLLNTSGVEGSELIVSSVGGGWKVELLSSNEVANLYTTYTWTGAAGDQDWNNAANWDANGIPVDDSADTTNKYAGLTMPYKDSIVFAGSAMPTSNVPEIGGWYDSSSVQGDSPTMVFNSGGEVSFDVTGEFFAFLTNPANDTRSVLTVGDGIGGGTDDVIVNVSVGETNALNGSLNRHNNGTHDYLVKSDGTLVIENAVTNYVDLSYNTDSRIVTFTIEGGDVVINDAVQDLSGNCYVSFTTAGGTFTAKYGSQFPTIEDVWASLGTAFVDNTGNALGTIQAVDVDGTNFTVSVAATATQWESAQAISGDGDVSTEGSLVYAYNAGSASDTTVNGVTFTGTDSATSDFGGNISLTLFDGATSGFGGLADPYTNLTASYQSLLSTAVTNGAATSAITLNNLTIGKRYQVQVWVNDSSSANTNAQDAVLSVGTATSVTLDPADPNVEGALGQYAFGYFVADAASQTFALGSDRLQLNAIQVRQVNELNVGYWTGTGGATWDAATTANFAVNTFGEALNVTTFDAAKAVNGTVTFADSYYDSGTPVIVTETSITIAEAVEAEEVNFVNDSVEYTLTGASIAVATAVEVSGGGTVNFDGNDVITSSGSLTVDNGSTLVSDRYSLQSHTGDIILNGGEISETGGQHLQLNNQNIILGSGGGTLTHVHARNIYNIGVISGSGQLTIDNRETSNAGRVQLASANTYTGGTVIQNGGQGWAYSDASFGAAGTQVTSINGGDVQLVNNINFGSRDFVIESGTMDIKGGKLGQFGGTISGAGALNLNSGGSAYIKGDNTYTGGTTIQRYTRATQSTAFGAGDVTISGAQLQNNDSTLVFANNFIIADGEAELKAGWNKDMTINGDLSGSGNLTIVADSGTVYLNGDGSGFTGTNTVASGANMGGSATLGGVLNVQSNATLDVGSDGSIGTLSVSGDVTLAATSTVEMEAAGTSSDSIAVGGALDLTGATLTLNISSALTNGGVTLATAGSITGEFDGYPEGTEVQAGYVISYGATAITLAPVGPYESPAVDSSVSGGVLTLSWPSSIHAGDLFNVMTNIDLVYGTWAVDTSMVPYLDGDSYKVTNSVGNAPQVFYKLEY